MIQKLSIKQTLLETQYSEALEHGFLSVKVIAKNFAPGFSVNAHNREEKEISGKEYPLSFAGTSLEPELLTKIFA